MSEYDRETGILKLSLEDALNFHRTADRQVDVDPSMEFYAEKLRAFGYKVSNVTNESLEVDGPEDEIFELLNGQQIYI